MRAVVRRVLVAPLRLVRPSSSAPVTLDPELVEILSRPGFDEAALAKYTRTMSTEARRPAPASPRPLPRYSHR